MTDIEIKSKIVLKSRRNLFSYFVHYNKIKYKVLKNLILKSRTLSSNNQLVISKLKGKIKNNDFNNICEDHMQQNELLIQALNASRDGLVIEIDEKILIVNDAFVKLYGYTSKEELIGKPISVIHADESDQMILEYGKKRLHGDFVPDVYEAKGKMKNGDIIDIEVTASVFEIQNQQYIVATNRNITERKKIQSKLVEQNLELQKINAELDKFVYSASHDLRAPLRSLLGLTNLFRLDTDIEKRDQYLDRMEKSIYKLDKFIEDIIQYSKNSRIEIGNESIDLSQFVNELVDGLKYEMNQNKIITINNDISDKIVLVSDKFRLELILNNLISNSLRYFDPNKSNPYIRIGTELSGNNIILTVEDNGIGIAKESIGSVFDMFYRAHDQKVGTGLGLFIVKETVNMLNYKIELHSEIGVGTTFTLVIPISNS